MAANSLPDQAYLAECFTYDPETGVLRWRDRPRHHFKSYAAWLGCRNAGKIAGTKGGGYILVSVGGRGAPLYRAHRLIWKLVHGTEPTVIDHWDKNPNNNRMANLRPATKTTNGGNSKVHINNQIGLKGVGRGNALRTTTFYAAITISGRKIRLGSFPTAEEAHAAYCAAAREYFGEFWSPG